MTTTTTTEESGDLFLRTVASSAADTQKAPEPGTSVLISHSSCNVSNVKLPGAHSNYLSFFHSFVLSFALPQPPPRKRREPCCEQVGGGGGGGGGKRKGHNRRYQEGWREKRKTYLVPFNEFFAILQRLWHLNGPHLNIRTIVQCHRRGCGHRRRFLRAGAGHFAEMCSHSLTGDDAESQCPSQRWPPLI